MKDMGKARYVLGMEIVRDCPKKLRGLCRKAYIEKVLEHFWMHYSKPIDTPVKKGLTLSIEQCPTIDDEKQKMSNVPYASAVGNLMYAMLYTRPDICFVVSLVSHYQSNPGTAHWQAIKRIIRYLRGTTDLVLCYQEGDLKLRGYSDADWHGDFDESKPTSGYVSPLVGEPYPGAVRRKIT